MLTVEGAAGGESDPICSCYDIALAEPGPSLQHGCELGREETRADDELDVQVCALNKCRLIHCSHVRAEVNKASEFHILDAGFELEVGVESDGGMESLEVLVGELLACEDERTARSERFVGVGGPRLASDFDRLLSENGEVID